MPGLTIGWEYLTGRCVATNPATRERAEWPPHPARVYMAMAAAWFETGEDAGEGQALRWLETLGDPELLMPVAEAVSQQSIVNVFVPVNDSPGPSSALLQSAPITRTKQSRTFPAAWVGQAHCYLRWPNVNTEDLQNHREALSQLCGKVTRIGHSSSLVRMWVAEGLTSPQPTETWIPDDGLADLQVRSHQGVSLDRLPDETGIRRINEFARLEAIINMAAEDAAGKRMKKQAEDEYRRIFGEKWKKSATAPPYHRPKVGLWTGYRRKESGSKPTRPHTVFDTDLLILTQFDGPRLPPVSTLTVTQALRGAILEHLRSNIPDWVSGHKANGEPLRNGNNQLAFIPLPFVGYEHADGHLLGIGLVFPRSVPRSERGRVLGRFLVSNAGQPSDIQLTLGRLGIWTIRKRDWMEHRQTLRPETWTAHPRGYATWATVNPVVLDRFPKCDPVKERREWHDEVAGIIATACERLGLPSPVEVAVGTTSWHRGSPRAIAKRRPLRGDPHRPNADAPLGDGFPPYPSKGGNGHRPQLHVFLRFAEPVVGPVLLGAGRFLGYGLCKPLWRGANR
jgi:CRISPR-associated protein Csb2